MNIEWLQTILSGIDWPQVMLGGISAGLGTLLGAWAAFRHERADRLEQLREARQAAVKKTLFTLLSQRTILANLDGQFLERFRHNRAGRHILLPAFNTDDHELSLDIEPLLFMLDTADANLLNRLFVSNRRYLGILAVVRRRSALSLEVQRLLAEQTGAEQMTLDQLRAVIGDDRWYQLSDLTNSMYDLVDQAMDAHKADYEALEALARTLYPKLKLFRIEYLSPVQPTPSKLETKQ